MNIPCAGKFWTTDNPVARLFRPRVSQTVRVERTADGEPAGVLVYDNVLSERMRENGLAVPAVSAVLMVCFVATGVLSLVITAESTGGAGCIRYGS
jgi:hypothetical protein